MNKEYWKDIENYPNYQVSDLGSVRNKLTGKLLRPENNRGYLRVVLCKDGKPKKFFIHRLVATVFIDNPYNKKEVNHINGCKTDNCVDNLEWNTSSENMIHSYRVLKNKSFGGVPKQPVRCIETGQVFESQSDTARYFGCDRGLIYQSIHKGLKVLKKYHFELI